MDFPGNAPLPSVLSTLSECSIGQRAAVLNRTGLTVSSTAGVANRAVYVPITLRSPYLVRRMWWLNVATVSGNIDVGIYAADGVRLYSSGSTAQSGANALQSVSLSTPMLLSPGLYYLAQSKSNATGTVYRIASGGAQEARLFGSLMQESAFPLPATATFATTASTSPVIGITSRSTI